MKFDLKNALIGGLIALLAILVIVAMICALEHNFFAAGIVSMMAVLSTFVLFGIIEE